MPDKTDHQFCPQGIVHGRQIRCRFPVFTRTPLSVRSVVLPTYLPKQPGARVGPVTLGRRLRDAERLRRLFDSHADEIAQLDQFRLAPVVGGKAVERLMHGELFVFITAGRGDLHGGVIDVDPLQITPVANRFLTPSVVNNDPAHGLRGDGEEMGLSLPLPAILAGKLCGSEAAKFVLNQRQELLSGLGLARLDRIQDFADLVHAEPLFANHTTHQEIYRLPARSFSPANCSINAARSASR